jgi:hypothetical protein
LTRVILEVNSNICQSRKEGILAWAAPASLHRLYSRNWVRRLLYGCNWIRYSRNIRGIRGGRTSPRP